MELRRALMFRMLVLVMMCSELNARASNVINSSCSEFCGKVRIPYPFGIGKGCYVGDWFEIVCRNDSISYNLGFSKPFLKRINLEILQIRITGDPFNSAGGAVRVNYPIFGSCSNGTTSTKNVLELEKSPFVFSYYNNSFVAMGCNNSASMWSLPGDLASLGGRCKSPCDRPQFTIGSLCNATNCCQIPIPSSDIHAFSTTIEPENNGSSSECNYAFLVDQDWFETNFTEPNPNMSVPVVLEWVLDNTSFHSLPSRRM